MRTGVSMRFFFALCTASLKFFLAENVQSIEAQAEQKHSRWENLDADGIPGPLCELSEKGIKGYVEQRGYSSDGSHGHTGAFGRVEAGDHQNGSRPDNREGQTRQTKHPDPLLFQQNARNVENAGQTHKYGHASHNAHFLNNRRKQETAQGDPSEEQGQK